MNEPTQIGPGSDDYGTDPAPVEAKDIVERLTSEGKQGLDRSPGDPLCAEAAALITSLRSDLAKSQQLVKDGCDEEDACRRLLARFDKSDSELTYSVVVLVEEAVKTLDITGSSQSATPAADLIKKRAMDHRLNMVMAGLRRIAECEYPEPGLRDEAVRVLQAVYATLGDDEALVRSALSAPALPTPGEKCPTCGLVKAPGLPLGTGIEEAPPFKIEEDADGR